MAAGLVGWTFCNFRANLRDICSCWTSKRDIFNSIAILVAGLAKGTFCRLGHILRDILFAGLNKGRFCNCWTKLRGVLLLLWWLEGYFMDARLAGETFHNAVLFGSRGRISFS